MKNYSSDFTNSMESLVMDPDMKNRIMDIEGNRQRVLKNAAKIRRRKARKRTITFFVCLILLFAVTNTTTYAMTGQHIWNFFFSEKEKEVYEPLLDDTDYGFVVDGYVFKLVESLYEKNTQSGCFVVSISKDGMAPEIQLDDEKHMISEGFGDNNRFELFPFYRSNIIYEVKEDALYACLIYHGNVEDFTRFELVDYNGPMSLAGTEELSENGYEVENLGKTQVFLTESGRWVSEDCFKNGLGIEFFADMTGGYYCLKGEDESGIFAYVSPFGFMVYMDVDPMGKAFEIHKKDGTSLYTSVNYSGIVEEEIFGKEKLTGKFYGGGTYENRLDLEQIESITVGDCTLTLTELKEDKAVSLSQEPVIYNQEDLSEEELEKFTQWANDVSHYGFLCCSYDNVENLDFDTVLMNGAGMEYEEVTPEEVNSYNFAYVPGSIKIKTDTVEEFMQKMTGNYAFSMGNSKYYGIDCILTNYFYIQNEPVSHGKFLCKSGQKEGDTYTLQMKCDDYSSVLVLREMQGYYRVVSHVIDGDLAVSVNTTEERWGMVGQILTETVEGVEIYRKEQWSMDGDIAYEKVVTRGVTTHKWNVYEDHVLIYEAEVEQPSLMGSGSLVNCTDWDFLTYFSTFRAQVEQADVTGQDLSKDFEPNYSPVGEMELFGNEYAQILWPNEYSTSYEDHINANLYKAYGKRVGDSFTALQTTADGRTIMRKFTILEIMN